MKILHLNAMTSGGAGRASTDLHLGLLDANIDSKLLVQNSSFQYPEIYRIDTFFSRPKRALKEFEQIIQRARTNLFMSKFPMDSTSFTPDYACYRDITKNKLYKEADIIHLHWVAQFINFKSFFRNNTKPIVWTLHDMHPFTAGNHYNFSEGEAETYHNFTSNIIKQRKQLYSKHNISLIPTTAWIEQTSKNSEAFSGRNHYRIPLGIDTKTFNYKNKNLARELLGLPKNKKILLFAAQFIKSKRKGFHLLEQAVESIQDKDIYICIFGNTDKTFKNTNNVIPLGYLNDNLTKNLTFAAADVFVTPSLEEAFGLTTIEALCSGTPVVSFDTGIAQEVIINGKNGMICQQMNSEALQIAILEVLDNVPKFNSEEISNEAIALFNKDLEVKRHINLYEKILNGKPNKQSQSQLEKTNL